MNSSGKGKGKADTTAGNSRQEYNIWRSWGWGCMRSCIGLGRLMYMYSWSHLSRGVCAVHTVMLIYLCNNLKNYIWTALNRKLVQVSSCGGGVPETSTVLSFQGYDSLILDMIAEKSSISACASPYLHSSSGWLCHEDAKLCLCKFAWKLQDRWLLR
jgi:hypothetical protein